MSCCSSEYRELCDLVELFGNLFSIHDFVIYLNFRARSYWEQLLYGIICGPLYMNRYNFLRTHDLLSYIYSLFLNLFILYFLSFKTFVWKISSFCFSIGYTYYTYYFDFITVIAKFCLSQLFVYNIFFKLIFLLLFISFFGFFMIWFWFLVSVSVSV